MEYLIYCSKINAEIHSAPHFDTEMSMENVSCVYMRGAFVLGLPVIILSFQFDLVFAVLFLYGFAVFLCSFVMTKNPLKLRSNRITLPMYIWRINENARH